MGNAKRALDLELSNVSLQYPSDYGTSRYAVRSFSLRVPQYQTVCLVGESGSGKTTVIRMLAGLEAPTEGTLSLGGKEIPAKPSADRAMVFQEDAVFPWMTVYDNIDYPSKIARLPSSERKRRTEKFLDMVGLREYANAWPKQLSGGMRKRVDVARAYPSNPHLLLMDEPFGSLDVMTKEHLQLALSDLLQSEPKTTVFVTHDIEEAIFIGDVVIAMREGEISKRLEIPFERPRSRELKDTEDFLRLKIELSAELFGRRDRGV